MPKAGVETFDYIVVGSGADGGTVAARLAEGGMSVLILEAGADPAALPSKGLPEDYDVPAFRTTRRLSTFAASRRERTRRARILPLSFRASRCCVI